MSACKLQNFGGTVVFYRVLFAFVGRTLNLNSPLSIEKAANLALCSRLKTLI